MIDYYNNETRLTEILRAVVNSSTIDLGPARTREEIFVSRAFGLTMWPAIPPRTTLEMWLAFIAGDAAEPAAGTYTVRTCAESCIITYARRVRGASAVVPIFVPHTHYERALAKLAGIVPLDWGVLGREWEHLLQTITVSTMPRSAVAVIGGERVSVGPGGEITPYQAGSGDASPDNIRPIYPGMVIVRDDDTTLVVWGGMLDKATRTLTVDRASVDLGTLTYSYIDAYKIFITSLSGVKNTGGSNVPAMISSMYKGVSWDVGATDATKDGIMCILTDHDQLRLRNLGYTDPTAFKTAMSGVQLVYELATPITYQLTRAEVQRALNCAEYLGVGTWRLSGGVTIIRSQIRTESPTNHYDFAASNEGRTFEITVDGTTVSGASGSLSVAAGDHDVVIVATPRPGAGVCIIHPTLYYTAVAGLLGSRQDMEEAVEPEEPEEPAEPEPVEPEPEEPAEPEPAEPEPEEPAEPEPVEPEPEEPAEPEPVEPEPEEPAEPEPVEPEPEEPAEPEEPQEPKEPKEPVEPEEPQTTKRRRKK